MLLVFVAACFASPENVADGVLYDLEAIGSWLVAVGYAARDLETVSFRFFVAPLLVGAVLSGPALALGLAFGWLANRYEFVVVRRSETRLTPPDAPSEETAS